jgi:predicted metal-dependent peptidase
MTALPERMRRARLQLMLRHPFLAGATARLPLIEIEAGGWCETAATDGLRIYWTSAFFDRLTDEEIMGVLAHEMLHAVLGHCERRGAREPHRWNMAIDHATNLLVRNELGLQLPDPHLAKHAFRNMTAEAIYDALDGVEPAPRPAPRVGAGIPVPPPPPPQHPSIGAARQRKAQAAAQAQAKAWAQAKAKAQALQDAAARKAAARGPAPASPLAEGFDVHLDPDDPRARAQGPGDDLTPLERARLRLDLQRDLRDGLASGRGTQPREIEEAIVRARRAHAPWQALLARCFTGIRRDDYRMLPPSRRHIWRGILLPSVGVPGPTSIVCAIDTSGSIDTRLAARFLAEVHALRCTARCRLHVLQCDAAIADHQVYEAWEQPPPGLVPERLKGRGGTDFRPVFDLVAEELSGPEGWPDLVAYLTDGDGTYPERPPPYPVVWLLPEKSPVVPPFGMRIEIPPR